MLHNKWSKTECLEATSIVSQFLWPGVLAWLSWVLCLCSLSRCYLVHWSSHGQIRREFALVHKVSYMIQFSTGCYAEVLVPYKLLVWSVPWYVVACTSHWQEDHREHQQELTLFWTLITEWHPITFTVFYQLDACYKFTHKARESRSVDHGEPLQKADCVIPAYLCPPFVFVLILQSTADSSLLQEAKMVRESFACTSWHWHPSLVIHGAHSFMYLFHKIHGVMRYKACFCARCWWGLILGIKKRHIYEHPNSSQMRERTVHNIYI